MRGGLILAAQRGPGRTLAGYWEFPGGKIEPGETPQQALARELREELQIEVEVGEFVARAEHTYEFGTVRLDAYFCTLKDDEPHLTEHLELRWLDVDQLAELDWTAADIPIIEELRRRL